MKRLLLPILLLIGTMGAGQEMRTVVKKLEQVNSTSDELMPVFSYDGKTMYFVRGFHPGNVGGPQAGQDIWFSEIQEDSSWGAPQRFEQPLNNDQDNSVCGISKDGKTLFLDNIYDKRKRMHPGLSNSKLNDKGEWSQPETVEIEDFHPKPPFLEFSFPETFSNVILISQEHEDTARKEDLYVTFKKSDGTWGKTKHMGDVLNSKGYEIAPFLAKDGKTLYFASNGHGGEGHCDIFKSTRLDNSWTKWSEPVNLGPDINTDGFDAYFTVDTYGRSYYVSGNLEDGDDDIYMITYEPIPLPEPEPVAVVEEVVDTPLVASPYYNDYLVNFELDKADIDAEGVEILVRAVAALRAAPNRKIVVESHTCDLGSSEYNQKLSERRTKSVLDYLIKMGVDKSRIQYESKGLSQPKIKNDSDEHRAMNRRSEITVFDTAWLNNTVTSEK